MKLVKNIVEKMGCVERNIYYLGNKGNSFNLLPSREFFREHYDNLNIKFDYHVNFEVNEDEEMNDFLIKIKLELDDNTLVDMQVIVKFAGSEMSGKLSAKYKFANQEVNGFPVTIVGYNTMDINSKLSKDEFPELKSSSRFAFSTQLPISRKFSNSFSMELNPIYIHKNLYEPLFEEKDNFLLALGGRYKLSKRISLNMEYAARLNARETSFYHNPATIGIDIETGGHVFQLVFSNSQAMNDVSYFTNANGITEGKGIYFGFNMYRVF
jgi:hypothetical protein